VGEMEFLMTKYNFEVSLILKNSAVLCRKAAIKELAQVVFKMIVLSIRTGKVMKYICDGCVYWPTLTSE